MYNTSSDNLYNQLRIPPKYDNLKNNIHIILKENFLLLSL